jgi:hypothetical protein
MRILGFVLYVTLCNPDCRTIEAGSFRTMEECRASAWLYIRAIHRTCAIRFL